MDPDRLNQLVGDVLADAESDWPKTRHKLERVLKRFAAEIEQAIAPQQTGARRRIYGQVTAFRVECPACGAIILTHSLKRETYDPKWQRARCPNFRCDHRWVVGLILWPMRFGQKVVHVAPSDTIPPLRTLPHLKTRQSRKALDDAAAMIREDAKAILAETEKYPGDPVNVLEDNPLLASELAAQWDDGNEDPWPR
jgi:hypothetical protein